MVPTTPAAAWHALSWRKWQAAPGLQSRGLGKGLLAHALDYAREQGAIEVVLSTNDILTPALAVYRDAGFVVQPAAKDERYERSNLFMVLTPHRQKMTCLILYI